MHAVYTTGIGKSPSQEVGESPNEGCILPSSQPPPQPGTPRTPRQLGDYTRLHRVTVDLTVFTAEANVELDKKRSAELLRSTKKQPPPRLTYGLIYVST